MSEYGKQYQGITGDKELINERVTENRNPNQISITEDEKKQNLKLVAYGKSAAFQVEQSMSKDGKHTIMIEAATNSNNSDRRYDWSNKLCFQLSFDELPVFCAVMLGMCMGARFDMHGLDKSKFFDAVNQNKNFYLKLGANGICLKVAPVSVIESYHFGMLALNEYGKNFPDLSI
jgi:hypothetical protein